MRPIFRTVLSTLVACSFVVGQSTSNIEAKIDSLLQKMTFAEKIGQLNQLSGRSARTKK